MKINSFFILLFLAFIFISCDYIFKPNIIKQEENVINNDVILGSDKDKHGCIPSAGYRWSEVLNECIRVFEQGMRLVPVSDVNSDIEDDTDQALFNAYMVIDSIKNRAEIFIASDTVSSIVLEADGNNIYKNKYWKLHTQQQFKLEYKGILKFVSPQAIEKTNIGSDVEEL